LFPLHTLKMSGSRLLSAAGREHIRRYKYVGVDNSLMYKYIFSPWAQFCVDAFTPLWIAPNLITLLGLCWQFAALLCALYYAPNFREPVPQWVPIFSALAMFIYVSTGGDAGCCSCCSSPRGV
jgi:ethanolaminephosphotransferase